MPDPSSGPGRSGPPASEPRTVASGTSRRPLASLRSGDYWALEGRAVDVQVDITEKSTPNFVVVGLAGRSTRESRDRIRAAIRNSGFRFPRARILVNLAPAAQEKQGAGFDLAVALGILLASGQVEAAGVDQRLARSGWIGELGLEGELRPVRGALLTSDTLLGSGVDELVVPLANADEASFLGRGTVFGVASLREAVEALRGELEPYRPPEPDTDHPAAQTAHDFAEVRGQEATKRGLLIAAAGHHNTLLSGPPGVGKTMLARRIPGILTPLTTLEAMEVLRVQSVVGAEGGSTLRRERPFRAPHHTVSYAGLVGGGSVPAPGEVTRAHRGVLFLDEFPEFARRALEALREPLEEGHITIGRSTGAVTFPARFLLVAAMNPCPCGFLGHPRRACRCTERQIDAYRRRLSGPLCDRLDIVLRVPPVDLASVLRRDDGRGLDSSSMARQVARARELQSARWGAGRTNGQASLRQLLERGCTSGGALAVLRRHGDRHSLSARSSARCLRVARTIADLAGEEMVGEECVLEALSYRKWE